MNNINIAVQIFTELASDFVFNETDRVMIHVTPSLYIKLGSCPEWNNDFSKIVVGRYTILVELYNESTSDGNSWALIKKHC